MILGGSELHLKLRVLQETDHVKESIAPRIATLNNFQTLVHIAASGSLELTAAVGSHMSSVVN
jgi:hypothetical protein